MTVAEIALFTALLRPARNYVEFGCGGSTVLSADIVAESITSVDSSREWLTSTAAACRDKRIKPRFLFVDIGPIGEWGYPIDASTRDRWGHYHSRLWVDVPEARDADTFLIDGRFRVACFLQSLLHSKHGSVFIIHDFTSRAHYHSVLEFAREIAREGDLSGFVRRDNFDSIACQTKLTRFAYCPD